jgi:hypothetical protein
MRVWLRFLLVLLPPRPWMMHANDAEPTAAPIR